MKYYLTPFNEKSIVYYHMLKNRGESIVGFMDGNPYLWDKEYDGIGIFQRCMIIDATVIICSDSHKIQEEIKQELLNLGYEEDRIESATKEINISCVVDDIKIEDIINDFPHNSSKHMRIIEKLKKYKKLNKLGIKIEDYSEDQLDGLNRIETIDGFVVLKQFELILTNRCTLRCKKCAAGIQYFSKPRDLELDRIIKDYNRAIEIIDWVDRIVLIGGEPFLFSGLNLVIEAMMANTLTLEKTSGVTIITNGTIVPNQELLKTISKNKISVWISNYKNKSPKVGELIEQLRKEKIEFAIMNVDRWSDVIQLVQRDTIQDKQILLDRRKTDCVTRCRTVANGRFYLCSLLKSMDFMNFTPYDKTNYVDIYGDDAKERIIEMLNIDNPLPNNCSFCT